VVEALCHQLTHSNAEGYAECCEALAAADLRSEVGQIRVPTLLPVKVTLSLPWPTRIFPADPVAGGGGFRLASVQHRVAGGL
jgi:hypothetical protein